MIKRKLFWQFYFSFLIITLISVAIVAFTSSAAFKHFHLRSVRRNLKTQAIMVETLLSESILTKNYQKLDRLSKQIGKQTNTRITVILAGGEVVADSIKKPARMDDHSDRPEILEVWQKGIGIETRYSDTIKHNMMYMALPLKKNNEIIAIIRTSMQVDNINDNLSTIFYRIAQLGIALAILLAIVCYLVSKRISKPIEQMKESAERFSTGRLNADIELPKTQELKALAVSLNKMARQLSERIETITTQKNELQAVLSSMSEGVIAIDSQSRIININKTARQLLDIQLDNLEKRNIEEVVRDSSIQQFITDALKSEKPITMEITSGRQREKYLHIYGRKLDYSTQNQPGAIIVFNDVTKIRQLENVRRDFVANVSHELKTPITSIKGFVETLLEGAADSKEDTKRFLSIIARHTDRLNAIIEDLLILCRMQEGETERITLEDANIKDCILAAVETCTQKAKNKNVELIVKSDDIDCKIDTFLVEQALVNLIDNAIKYSEPEKKVEISARFNDKYIELEVSDQGYGIPAQHLERIFERFYVTDKARSRKLGGTGLGLSIVKHICQAHGGKVEVKSRLGQGSKFIIFLPNSQNIG